MQLTRVDNTKPGAAGTRRLGWILAILLASTIASLLFASVSYFVIAVVEQEPTNPKNLLLWLLVRFYVWAALSPLVFLMARRLPVRGVPRWRFFTAHFAASVLFSLFHAALYLPLFLLVDWPDSKTYLPSTKVAVVAGLNNVFPQGVVVYWMVLGIVMAVDFYRRYGRERLKASDLQKQLAEAQLDALKMQLQPHFLFNTLHSLSDMVLEDPREATRMIARLGDFLRLTLDNNGSQLVSLKKELEFLRCYLEIEQVRFQDRLLLKIDADPNAEPMLVPNLILQPLVENAIRHGIGRRIGPGRIEVRARQVNEHIEIAVRDDGPGLASEVLAGRQGVGLSNIRERLGCLYGEDAGLLLENDPDGGLVATLRLPVATQATFNGETGGRGAGNGK